MTSVDPATEAARAYASLAEKRGREKRVVTVADTIEAVLAACAPLIRRQAFNEAADKTGAEESPYDENDIAGAVFHNIWIHARDQCAALVRGLGEKEN